MNKQQWSAKKILSAGLLILFTGTFFYMFFESKYLYSIGSDGIERADIIAITHRAGDDENKKHTEINELIGARALKYYGQSLGLKIPECPRLQELRAEINKNHNGLAVGERIEKANTMLIQEQLMAPIKSIPVIDAYDEKIATTIARCVDGYFLRISRNTLPRGITSITNYMTLLKRLLKEQKTGGEKIAFLKHAGFTAFEDISHFSLFWGKKCPKCTSEPCSECIINTVKDINSFSIDNKYKLEYFEAAAISSAKNGVLQMFNRPDTSDWIAVFVTRSHIDNDVYEKVLHEVQRAYHNALSRLHEGKIMQKVQAGTDQNAAGWLMMLLFAIFMIYY